VYRNNNNENSFNKERIEFPSVFENSKQKIATRNLSQHLIKDETENQLSVKKSK